MKEKIFMPEDEIPMLRPIGDIKAIKKDNNITKKNPILTENKLKDKKI